LRNENTVVKREAEKAISEAGIKEVTLAPPPPPQKIVTNEPPKELLEELDALKVSQNII